MPPQREEWRKRSRGFFPPKCQNSNFRFYTRFLAGCAPLLGIAHCAAALAMASCWSSMPSDLLRLIFARLGPPRSARRRPGLPALEPHRLLRCALVRATEPRSKATGGHIAAILDYGRRGKRATLSARRLPPRSTQGECTAPLARSLPVAPTPPHAPHSHQCPARAALRGDLAGLVCVPLDTAIGSSLAPSAS